MVVYLGHDIRKHKWGNREKKKAKKGMLTIRLTGGHFSLGHSERPSTIMPWGFPGNLVLSWSKATPGDY